MFDKCVIVGSAPCEDVEYISRVCKGRFVICTDGGIKTARRASVKADLFIGDFDSSDSESADGIDVISLPCEKDVSDMQAAILHALSRGMNDIVMTACTNGRADHYLANLAMLELIFENGGIGVILDEQNKIFLHPTGRLNVDAEGYKYISLIALDAKVGPITIAGMKYSLDNAMLFRNNPLAISNEHIGENAYIELSSGRALVIYANDIFKE